MNKSKLILVLCSILVLVLSTNIASAARLPSVGSDSGMWGTILNSYLNVTHDENGTIKNSTIISNMINLSDVTLLTFTNDADFITSTSVAFNYYNKSTSNTALIGKQDVLIGNETVFNGWDKDVSDDFDGAYSSLSGAPTIVSTFTNDAGYLTSYTETDPIFTAWDRATGIVITESQISDLTHTVDTNTQLSESQVDTMVSNNGYLTSYTETDPIFIAWDKATGIVITESQISDLSHTVDTNTQLNESTVDTMVSNNGYLTSYTETDPLFTVWDKATGIVITESQISDLTHTVDTDTQLNESTVDSMVSNNGYLTSYSETDPIFSAWDKSTGIVITESQISDLVHTVNTDTQLNESVVDTMVSNNGYLTSYTETDPTVDLTKLKALVANDFHNLGGTDLDTTCDSGSCVISNTGTLDGYEASALLDNTDTQLNETQVDTMVSNNGYLTSYTETDPIFSAWDKATGIVITESQISDLSHTIDTNTQLEDSNISGMGYIKIDTNTQLNETQVDSMVSNNGYLTSYTETDPIFSAWDKATGIVITESQISDLSHTVDTNTQLNESIVDSMVSNNGYLTSYTETDPIFSAWDKATGIVITESQISDLSHTVDTDTQLSESQVDTMVSNNGYAAAGANTDISSLGPVIIDGTLIAEKDQASSFRLKGSCDSSSFLDNDVLNDTCQSYAGIFFNTVYDDTGSAKARTTRLVFGGNEGLDLEFQSSNDLRLTAVDNNNLGADIRIAASGNVQVHAGVAGAENNNLVGTFKSTGLEVEIGGSANKVICWKADGKTLGYCSDAPISDGSCTCN